MPEPSRSGRDPVRAHYSVSLLQAAAALYGANAVATLTGPPRDPRTKTSRE